jgi:hypothetical protein
MNPRRRSVREESFNTNLSDLTCLIVYSILIGLLGSSCSKMELRVSISDPFCTAKEETSNEVRI